MTNILDNEIIQHSLNAFCNQNTVHKDRHSSHEYVVFYNEPIVKDKDLENFVGKALFYRNPRSGRLALGRCVGTIKKDFIMSLEMQSLHSISQEFRDFVKHLYSFGVITEADIVRGRSVWHVVEMALNYKLWPFIERELIRRVREQWEKEQADINAKKLEAFHAFLR